jgi:hypothetical protein
MEVKGKMEIWMNSVGFTKLFYRNETEEAYIEIDGETLRETNPTPDAYRSFVVGLAQRLHEERKLNKHLSEKLEWYEGDYS